MRTEANSRRRRFAACFGAAVGVMAIGPFAHGADFSTTWVGPASSNWNIGANWSGGNFPTLNNPSGAAYFAFIDGGNAQNSTVALNINATLKGLTISSGDTLNVGNFLTLTVNGDSVTSAISNAGTISLNSAPSATSLSCNGTTLTL